VAVWFAAIATRNYLTSTKSPLILTLPCGQHESFVFALQGKDWLFLWIARTGNRSSILLSPFKEIGLNPR
jgi:hypothetical protein